MYVSQIIIIYNLNFKKRERERKRERGRGRKENDSNLQESRALWRLKFQFSVLLRSYSIIKTNKVEIKGR